jgi:hypothetical protein
VSQFIVNKQNSGSTFKQWQRGIELAKGEYIWIAESDDYSDIAFLENNIKMFQKDTSIAFSYCRTKTINEKDGITGNEIWGEAINPQVWEEDRVFTGTDLLNEYFKYRNIIPNTSAVVFQKKYFDPWIVNKLRYCGDWLLWGIMCKDAKVGFISKHLNFFRHHDGTTRVFKSKKHQINHARECQFVIISIRKILIKSNSLKFYGNDSLIDNRIWKIKIWIFYKFYFLPDYFSIKLLSLKTYIKSIPGVYPIYKIIHAMYSSFKNYFRKKLLKHAS